MATRRKIRYETKNRKVDGNHCDGDSKVYSHRNTKSITNHVNHHTNSTRPTTLSSSWWHFILHQTIECWIHQLLYLRQVYPPYTFVQQRQREEIPGHLKYPNTTTSHNTDSYDPDLYLDFRNNDDGDYYHWNIHPQVNAYIQTVLRTAIPSLISGVATELQFHVIQNLPLETATKTGNDQQSHDEGHHDESRNHPPHHILETFTIRMKGNSTTNHDIIHHPLYPTTAHTIPLEVIQHVKDGMKHLIQSHIRTLECSTITTSSNQNNHSTTTTTTTTTKNSNADGSISFQLVLHVPPLSKTPITNNRTRSAMMTTTTVPTGNPNVVDNNKYYYREKNPNNHNHNNEIQQALQTGTWYTLNHHHIPPPVEEDHIIYIDDTDDDDDDNMNDNKKHVKDDNNKTTTKNTTTTTINKKTIRPIYSYTENQYIGIQIQCSMLRYSNSQFIRIKLM